MSANIEERNGVYSFVENTRKHIAWHGLGQHLDGNITAKEALEQSHADFKVDLRPILSISPELEYAINEGQYIDPDMLKKLIVDGKKATMRLDYNETLGIVSDSYGIVQNADAFNFIDLLTTGELGGDTPTIECAGVLGKGERIFITAKFPTPIRLSNNDEIETYAVFTTSHDGSGAVSCCITNVRVVCQNTLNLALSKNSGRINYRHTRYVGDRIDLTNKENAKLALDTLKIYGAYREEFESKMKALAEQKLTDKWVDDILAKTLLPKESYEVFKLSDFGINAEEISTRSKNTFTNVKNALFNGVGQEILEPNTGLWLVNGLTTYYQNNVDWKNDEKKFDAIMDGSVYKKLQTMYDNLALVA